MYAGQEAVIKTGYGTMDWFKIEKGVYQGVYFHRAYLTSMQSTSCEMPGWMASRLQEELSTSDMQMIPLQWQKVKKN